MTQSAINRYTMIERTLSLKCKREKSEGQNMRIIIIDRITNVCEMRNEVAA